MKRLMQLSLVLMLLGIAGITQASSTEEVSLVSSKYKNLFVLKTGREYAGGRVEVYYSNGDLVTAQKLGKRKMIIDFCDTKFGEYTIRVVKGEKVQEFRYVKK
ncbi:MAG TPA: hypothetical protein VGK39_01150 [Cyclobacteriaceae bacterium]